MCSARRCWKNSGAERALAPGGGHVPPGGLGLFRQAVLADAPGGRASGHKLCVLFLTDNDVLLGLGRCCTMSG